MTDNHEDRTTPIGLARYAREYYEAALAADQVLGRKPGYEIVAPAPVMFLVAHSIELAFKSFLRFQGWPLDDLKRLSHRLMDCWDQATKCGIVDHIALTKDELEVLAVISDLHASTELRYIQTGFKTFPAFGPLERLNRRLLDVICPLVGFR